MGSSYFYTKYSNDDEYYYQQDNTGYDVDEPSEASPDPQVPSTGPEFSSDEAGDGPVKQNSVGGRRIQERNVCKTALSLLRIYWRIV